MARRDPVTSCFLLILFIAVPLLGSGAVFGAGLNSRWSKQQEGLSNPLAGGDASEACIKQVAPAALPYLKAFRSAAKEREIDLTLMIAIAQQESGFTPHGSVNAYEAFGIMQTTPEVYNRYKRPADPLVTTVTAYDEVNKVHYEKAVPPSQPVMANVEANTYAAAGKVKFLIDRYSKDGKPDLDKVIAAYNAGEGNVDKYNGIPPFEQTQAYVKNVQATLKNLQDCVQREQQRGGSQSVGNVSYTPAAATLAKWVEAHPEEAAQKGKSDCACTVIASLNAAFSTNTGAVGPVIRTLTRSDRTSAIYRPPDAQDLEAARRILAADHLPVWHIRGDVGGQHWIVVLKVDGSTIYFYDPNGGQILQRDAGDESLMTKGKDQSPRKYFFSITELPPNAYERGYEFTPPAK